MEPVGFIGLGIMGKPMAKNLLKAGVELVFYARRPDVIREMEALGATAVGSAKAVAEATDIVITIVTADPEVRAVILEVDGVLEGASEGNLIVDMSTISPLTIRMTSPPRTKMFTSGSPERNKSAGIRMMR